MRWRDNNIHKDISDHNAHRTVVVSKIHCSKPPEILREAFFQHPVVFRRQANRKVDLLKRRIGTGSGKLLSNGKE